MSFSFEKDMYSTALEQLPAFFDFDNPYAYGIEIPLSYRIADIGFIPLVGRNYDTLQAHSLARLSLATLWALARVIEDGEISIYELSSVLGGSITDKDQVIASLCKIGLLKQNDQGKLVPAKWLIHQLGPIVLVELKLSRWQQALDQARFYLEKADMACVVLEGESASTVPKEYFVEEGIGLFAAWPGHIEMLVTPKPSTRISIPHKHFHRLRAIQDLSRKRPRKWVVVY